MATFLNRTGTDGTQKIKVLARVWLNGKQINKIKTFSENEYDDFEQEARKWAEQTENALKTEKAKLLYQATMGAASQQGCTDLKLKVTHLQGRTLGDYFSLLGEAIKQLHTHFSHIELRKTRQINTNQVWKYIMARYEAKASRLQIDTELQLLRELVSQLNPEQEGDIVSLAYQAALADGADFLPS
ncbi:MAG: hypothetical protein ACR2PT_10115 [Endozoicomonas sp.]